MKTTKILYWVFTVLLIAFMLFSSIGTLFKPDQTQAFAKTIAFPAYLLGFLAVAKILGSIAILVPGLSRLKEWAYAGFTFDLLGACYIFIQNKAPLVQWGPFMLGGFIFIFGSYICYHKLKRN
ncbi:MAG: DoxX family protein [Bacteroidetes bacterium]|nr:DoxX family protein [Bacteroidota bacterium]